MSCEKIRQVLIEDPSAEQSSEVRSHLEACQECRKLHEDLLNLEQLSGLLKDQVSAPSDFASRVVSRADRRTGWRFGFLSGTAAVSLLLVAATLVGWNAPDQAQPEVAREVLESVGSGPERIVFKEFSAEEIIGVKDSGVRSDDYVEIIVENATGSEYLLRVPSTIKIRRSDLHHDLYFTDVSY
jgi:hypothetical protein